METDDPRGYPHWTRAGGPARLKNLTYGNVALIRLVLHIDYVVRQNAGYLQLVPVYCYALGC